MMMFRLAATLPLVGLLALAACVHPSPRGRVSGYSCAVDHSGAQGSLHSYQQVDLEGRPGTGGGSWKRRVGTVQLDASWGSGESANLADSGRLNVTIMGPRRYRRFDVAIRFRREREAGPGQMIPANTFADRSWAISIEIARLKLLTSGGRIEVAAMDGKGNILGQGIFDAVLLDHARTLALEARAETEALRADFHTLCLPSVNEYGDGPGSSPQYSCAAELKSGFGTLAAERDITDAGQPARFIQHRWYRHWRGASFWARWEGEAVDAPPDTARVEVWLSMNRPPSGVDQAVLRLDAGGDPGSAINGEPSVLAEADWPFVELHTDWGTLARMAAKGPLTLTALGPNGEVLTRAAIDRGMIETPATLAPQLRATLDARVGQWRKRCLISSDPASLTIT